MIEASSKYPALIGSCCVGALLLFSGCAASGDSAGPPPTRSAALSSAALPQRDGPPVGVAPVGVAVVQADEGDDSDARALAALWRARNGDASVAVANSDSGFVIGPGDVLRVSLPQLDQLRDRRVRVSENDTIDLPLLGVINVAGMTQAALHDELSRRLEKYVYRPQVAVYLEHTENRVAAVLGAVKTPGRYMLASSSDTIMTMLSRAGGTTEDAASRVILIPASNAPRAARPIAVADNREADDEPAGTVAGLALASAQQPSANPSLPRDLAQEGIVIDLFHASNQRYLEMPVRMGDVIIVPVAGEVTVEGWVEKPGSFKITRGMTVLSAIAAAGGALFTSQATLLRENGSDTKVAMALDLSAIKQGSQRDAALRGGDVIVVERSAIGAIPYTAYFLINKMGWGIFPAL